MDRSASTILFVLGIITCQSQAACAKAPASADKFPVPIIDVRGEPAEMGKDYGRQLATSIDALHKGYLAKLFPTRPLHALVLRAADAYEEQLLPEHLVEIKAVAQGSKMDAREVMLGNCFLDILPIVTCSTIAVPAAAAPDQVGRFARNLDFPSLNIADKYSIVAIYHPKDRYAFAAVTWPGLVGVLSGMNEHGLTLCNMEVTRLPRGPQAMPYSLLYRSVLERCKTVDEAIEYLQKAKRQTANNLMLMDAAGARAVLEITPESIHVRRADDKSALVSTNHHRGDSQEPGRCRRYDYLQSAAADAFGKIDEKKLELMLGKVAMGRNTLQSMVFEPSDRVLYLAVGADAAHNTFHKLELRAYFK